jgi:PAS domain S-box-containing protein
VAVTALLLYALLRRQANPAASNRPEATSSGWRARLPFLALSAIVLALTTVGMVETFRQQRAQEVARLQAIADLKAREIEDWLKERQGDAEFARTSRFLSEPYQRWRETGEAAAREALRERLEEIARHGGYAAVMLLDERGEPLSSAGHASPAAPALLDAARQVRQDGQPHWAGPYRTAQDMLRLDLVAPLAKSGQTSPLLVLAIDPNGWLLPTLQAWPVPSASGEALLFQRDGDRALYLSTLRRSPDAAAKLRLPLAASKLLAAQALRGESTHSSPVAGEDYGGVPALGMVSNIPGTGWNVLAKLDLTEIDMEAADNMAWIGLAGFMALCIISAGYSLSRKSQRLALALAVQQSQAERLEALGLLAAIADSSDDAIFAKDLQGRYLLFNCAAGRFVGKAPEEVLGKDDRTLFPAHQADLLLEAHGRIVAEGRAETHEEALDTSQGKRIFLATKGPLRDTEGRIYGVFGMARDITARKAAEDDLRQRHEELWRFNRATVGRELDMVALKQEVNALCRELGRPEPYPLAFLDASKRLPDAAP